MVDWILVFLPAPYTAKNHHATINDICADLRNVGLVYTSLTNYRAPEHQFNPINTSIITVGTHARNYMSVFSQYRWAPLEGFILLINPMFALPHGFDSYSNTDAVPHVTAIGEKLRGFYPAPSPVSFVVGSKRPVVPDTDEAL